MKKVTVSLKTLYEKFGEGLEYGRITKTIDDDGQEYYELYVGEIVCTDGEECRVVNKGTNSILLENMGGEIKEFFILSLKEFSTGCFS